MNKLALIGDYHLGLSSNVDKSIKWFNTHKQYFNEFLLPTLKKNLDETDKILFMGDIFDNRTAIQINITNYFLDILEKLSKICEVNIILGNHDLYTLTSNDINSLKPYKYIPNVNIYEKTTLVDFFDKKVLLMPWVSSRKKQIELLKEYSGCDYLFCHSDLNGAKMHLTSVANFNKDKIDISEFSGYKKVYSGHIHILQRNKNFTYVGSIFQMDRNDYQNQKGIFILDFENDTEQFIPNYVSPIFRKLFINTESDLRLLDQKYNDDYIDIKVSNTLLSSKPIRKKFDALKQNMKYETLSFVDDIEKEKNVTVDVVNIVENIKEYNNQLNISFEFETIIKNYIDDTYKDKGDIKKGILKEFEKIISIKDE